MGCWSDLADDLLEHLRGLLSFPDQHRFSAVCHNWRLVAKQKRRYPPKPQLPWLVLGEDPKTKKRNFFSLSDQRYYSIDIPELHDQFICGSSHGWLITVDISITGHVINPFTRECIDLPPFPPFSKMHNITTYSKVPVYHPRGHAISFSFKEIQKRLVLKAVLSHDPREKSDNFNVAILFGDSLKIAIWRPGNNDWSVINSSMLPLAITDIFYFEGRLYALSMNFQSLFVIDVGDRSNTKLAVKIIDTHERDVIGQTVKYLMVFKGKLLILSRFEDANSTSWCTNNFAVRALEMKWCKPGAPENISYFPEIYPSYILVDEERWCELDNIDGHAVFVGKNSPISVNPTEFQTDGCIANGVYFGDFTHNHQWEKYGHDFGVYNMDKDVLGQFCCSCSDHVLRPPDAALTWFTPSFGP